jgi:hypothetical protein
VRRVFVTATLVVCAQPFATAHGQRPTPTQQPVVVQARRAQAEAQRTEENLGVAPPFAAATGSETRVFIVGGEKDASVNFSAGVKTTTTTGRTTAIVLGGTAPLQKGADDATFATRDRLSDGAEFTLKLHSVFLKPPPPAVDDSVIGWCHAEKKRDSTRLVGVTDCEELQSSQLSRLERERLKAFFGTPQPWVFDLSGKIGRASRQFLDAASLQPDSLDATAWSGGADIGRFFSAGPLRLALVTIGASYGVKYRPGKEGQGCVVIGAAGALQCRTASIGSPKRKEGGNLHGEVRAFLSDRFAVNPNYSFATAGRVSSYSMPIYFVPTAKGGLVGGVEPAWDSEERRFGLRAFIGTTAFGVGDGK